jgi:molybdopterin synthase catalytic subunit
MISCKVLFFASLKDLTGVRQVTLELPVGTTVGEFRIILKDKFPALTPHLPHALIAVNRVYALENVIIPPEGEIAVFPPVSGGSSQNLSQPQDTFPTVCVITEEPIDINVITAQITSPTTGAVVVFTGVVRGLTARDVPHETTYLEYEAYAPMAEAMMHQISKEIRSRWPTVEGIAIIQRIGHLVPGMPTTAIACAAAHRDTGVFEAARYGIDRLKEIVPVWKKETGSHGQEWVEGEQNPIPRPL